MSSFLNKKSTSYTGKGFGSSYAIGTIIIKEFDSIFVSKQKIEIYQINNEIKKFQKALLLAENQIKSTQKRLIKKMGQSELEIFDFYILILKDPLMIEEVISKIKSLYLNAEHSYTLVIKKIFKKFSNIKNEYFKSRQNDIKTVHRYVINHLQKKPNIHKTRITNNSVILVAKEISPSDFDFIANQNVVGVITEIGSVYSHTTIMMKSLDKPFIINVAISKIISYQGNLAIINGFTGQVVLNPSLKIQNQYQFKISELQQQNKLLSNANTTVFETADKQIIQVLANIELPREVSKIKQYGLNSVGLYRSEFLFYSLQGIPNEEQQYQAYFKIASELKEGSVIIRTFDSDDDKVLPGLNLNSEANPCMGWRSIRFFLDHSILFKIQIKAILKASIYKNLKLMLPLITTGSEITRAKKMILEVMQELKQLNIPFDEKILIGCMIETPSAALMIDSILKQVDFVNVGTNDLTQFTLAIDRNNEKVSALYESSHPAVLKLINKVVEACEKTNTPMCVCGEMTSIPLYSLILIALGVKKLSMDATDSLKIKETLKTASYKKLRSLKTQILACDTFEAIQQLINNNTIKLPSTK